MGAWGGEGGQEPAICDPRRELQVITYEYPPSGGSYVVTVTTIDREGRGERRAKVIEGTGNTYTGINKKTNTSFRTKKLGEIRKFTTSRSSICWLTDKMQRRFGLGGFLFVKIGLTCRSFTLFHFLFLTSFFCDGHTLQTAHCRMANNKQILIRGALNVIRLVNRCLVDITFTLS